MPTYYDIMKHMRTLEFDHKKATQALNFFAKRAGGKITKLNALKLIYLADRYHLRKYGRPIFSDTYWAMPYGPVASSVKDIVGLFKKIYSTPRRRGKSNNPINKGRRHRRFFRF